MINEFREENFFLSNFYKSPIKMDDGFTYTCAEAAFQAQKTFSDEYKRRFSVMDGKGAKYYGRQIELRQDWEDVKIGVMYDIVYAKFSQNPKLKQQLLNTGDEKLVEGNNWNDTFWGVCNGNGKNVLGKILMEVRLVLRVSDALRDNFVEKVLEVPLPF